MVQSAETTKDTLQETVSQLKEGLGELAQSARASLSEDLVSLHRKLRKQVDYVEASGKRLQQQVHYFDELVRTSILLNSTLEIDLLLEDVMDTIINLTGAERVYLVLYNDDRKLEVRAARNWDQRSVAQDEIGLSHSVINATLEAGEPIITTNAQADERFGSQASVMAHKLRSIICVPLAISRKPVGVLYADNRQTEALFHPDLGRILTAFGTQAALAIVNAHAFAEVKDNLEKAQLVIEELSINIDRERVTKQVTEITSSGFFEELAAAAKEMRRRQKAGEEI